MTTPTRPKRLFARLPSLAPRTRPLWMFALLVAASSLILAGCVLLPVLQGTWWIVLAIAALFGLAACGGSDSAPPIVLTPVVSKLLGSGSESAGTSVASAGNFGGDANADIVIGAPGGFELGGATFSFTGRAYVLTSAPPSGESNLSTEADAIIGTTNFGFGGLQIGQFVASAGNLNGDAYSELIVGAPSESAFSTPYGGSFASEAYVLLGSATPASTLPIETPANLERVVYDTSGSKWFQRGVGIGDFDGDGTPDLLAARTFGDGAVAIINGARTLSGTPPKNQMNDLFGDPGVSWSGFVLAGEAGSQLGQGVAELNWNGDTYADVAVGAPNDITATATVHVILGAANALVDSAGLACAASGSITDVGMAGTFVQDCDVIACNTYYVPHPTGFKITNSATAGARFGAALAAGDVNGDGNTDLLIGEPGYSSNTGRVYVLLGDGATPSDFDLAALPAGLDLVTIDPATGGAGGRFGEAVALADLNGDGKDEIVIGAPYAGPSSEGQVTVIMGRADIGASDTVDLAALTYGSSVAYNTDSITLQGLNGENAGTSLANAGDIDGDGREDLLIGAPEDSGSRNGAVYVIRLNAQ